MLSPKKEKFVEFIKEFTSISGRAPTFVEIMEGLNYSSLGTINWYIVELEKEGYIERVKGYNGKRALSILEENIDNQLPLLGVVSAGMPLEVYSHKEYIDVPPSMYKKDNYVLKVSGDSMKEDGILDGDYVIVEKNNIAKEGDSVIAIINGEATLKRYYIGSNGIELHPRNDKYGIIYVNEEDDFRIQGLLKGVFRKY
ncbi:MAG: repressor LexA [Candidatus Marinimicrobia bacterium]|nr:repressor LexA [Candidatus Neomarinimicrobiota bacterium]|tara:strand:- start:7077 stop:7670 length:594 start_codon:yes stop_codon:yes gene_type:complete